MADTVEKNSIDIKQKENIFVPFTAKERRALVSSCIMEFVHAMLYYYFFYALPLIFLKVHEIKLKKLALMTVPGYLIAFKFFWGPFTDRYFINKFGLGRRKFYFAIFSYIQCVIVFVGSLYINDWVENEGYFPLSVFCVVSQFFIVFQSNAVLGWMVTNIRHEVLPRAQGWNLFFKAFGAMIGFIGFIFISTDHLSEIIGFTAKICDHRTIMIFCSISFLVSGLVIHITAREEPTKINKNTNSVCKICGYWKIICTNPNFRKLSTWLSTRQIGSKFFHASGLILVLPNLEWYQIMIITIVASLTTMFWTWFYSKRIVPKKEVTSYRNMEFLEWILYWFELLWVIGFYNNWFSATVLMILLILEEQINMYPDVVQDVSMETIVLRVAENQIGGTITSLLICCRDFGKLWVWTLVLVLSSSLNALFSSETTGLWICLGCGLLWKFLYCVFVLKWVQPIEDVGPEGWSFQALFDKNLSSKSSDKSQGSQKSQSAQKTVVSLKRIDSDEIVKVLDSLKTLDSKQNLVQESQENQV